MNKDILVVEISGKRPGTSEQRPTEKNNIKYDHLIISNNSDNYETDWDIVNVPQDYVDWYKSNIKNSDNAWYAPMNRSYAIKYAREHGYKYLIQLDDNIVNFQIAYIKKKKENGIITREEYRAVSSSGPDNEMLNDFIDVLVETLKQTNAGIAGCNMIGAAMPGEIYLSERYCYSLFAINVDIVPDVYHGDFEDDIEFRLKLNQMNIPMVQNGMLMYGKTGQAVNKDLTGCRAEYLKAGVKRGEHMRKLYGDIYKAGVSSYSNRKGKQEIDEDITYFRHKLKPIKLGVIIKNKKAIDNKMKQLFKKYAVNKPNKLIIKQEKV